MKNKIKQPKKNKIDYGAKVKSFKTDNTLNKHLLLTFLIIFNIALIAGLNALVLYITKWYIILISILLGITCIIHSVITYLKVDKNYIYDLHENYLIIHNILFSAEIEIKNIVDAKPSKTILDKLFNLKTSTIEVSFKRTFIHKIKLTFLSEEADEVIKTIMASTVKNKINHIENKKTSES